MTINRHPHLPADTVSNFLVFAPVQILTKGGPQGSTDLIMNEVYTRAFINGDKGSADAKTSLRRSIFAREITNASKRKIFVSFP